MFGTPYTMPRFNVEEPLPIPFKAVITFDDGHNETLRYCKTYVPRESVVTIIDQYGIIHNYSVFHFKKIKVSYEKVKDGKDEEE